MPFDFERRRMSVVVCDTAGKTQMVTKGAVEEMLSCCAWAEREGQAIPLTDQLRARMLARAGSLNAQGNAGDCGGPEEQPRPGGASSRPQTSGIWC